MEKRRAALYPEVAAVTCVGLAQLALRYRFADLWPTTPHHLEVPHPRGPRRGRGSGPGRTLQGALPRGSRPAARGRRGSNRL